MKLSHALAGAAIAAFAGLAATLAADPPKTEEPAAKVSYYKDVRPVFAQHCNGCHQPAKPMGGFVMTEYAELLKAGEREKPGVVPGKPAQSYLLEQIKLHPNGKAEMPKGRDPLTAAQVKLVADWIAQGAADDTPASAKAVAVDRDHPPKYALPPVVTSLAFSPDGKYLAVLAYYDSGNLEDIEPAVRIDGVRLADLPRDLLTTDVTGDEWPREVAGIKGELLRAPKAAADERGFLAQLAEHPADAPPGAGSPTGSATGGTSPPGRT